ncbi:MAG: antitoxin Xre/MbcA/ParS toxin-binding domain-containing protein [Gammaproteobacteria bacterium]
MQFVELAAAAADVFGGVDRAATWLTRSHPMLEGETPLQRARTPWGVRNVLGILNALKYGGAA